MDEATAAVPSLPGVIVPDGEDVMSDFVLGVTELMVAAYRGDIDKVCEVLARDRGAVHRTNHRGVTALDYAADARHWQVVDVLLAHGADVDSLDSDGHSILHRSILSGQLSKVKTCLTLGANINALSRHGETALIIAVKHRYVDIVAYLIKMDCDVTPFNRDGASALEFAFVMGFTEIRAQIEETVQQTESIDHTLGSILISECCRGNVLAIESLLSIYGDSIVHFKDARNGNITPLCIACRHGHLSAAGLLLEHRASLHALSVFGDTPLICCAISGQVQTVKWLIDQGAFINARNAYGRTALHCTVIEGNLDVVKTLVENGILLNMRSETGSTALHIAVEKNFVDIVSYLLEHGACVDVIDEEGSTPLYAAVIGDLPQCMDLLLQYGATINIINKNNLSPLTIAAHLGFLSIVKMLVQGGADLGFAAVKGNTVYDVAFNNGSLNVFQYLTDSQKKSQERYGNPGFCLDSRQHTKYCQEQLFEICNQGTASVSKLSNLTEAGAEVNGRDMHGQTPLLLSVMKSHIVFVNWLLMHKADIDAADRTGVTPLMQAVQMGDLHMVQLLMKKGASTLVRDQQGRDVLDIAETTEKVDILQFLRKSKSIPLRNRGEREFYSSVVNACIDTCMRLLREGVNINCVDGCGRNALSWCIISDHSKGTTTLVEFLCKSGIDMHHKDHKGYTPFELCVSLGNLRLAKQLHQFGVQLDNLPPGILIDAWLSAGVSFVAALLSNVMPENSSYYLAILLQFVFANLAMQVEEVKNSGLFVTLNNARYWAMCEERVIYEAIKEFRGSTTFTFHKNGMHWALLKVGVERNLPSVVESLLGETANFQTRSLVHKESLLNDALNQGHFEVAAKMTTSTLLILDETRTEYCQKSPVKSLPLDACVHKAEELWMDTLNMVHKAVIHSLIRSHNITGISKDDQNRVLYVHTINKGRLSVRHIRDSMMAMIAHQQIYHIEIVEELSLAKPLRGIRKHRLLGHQQGSCWIQLEGVEDLCHSVGWIYEHSGRAWAITAVNSLDMDRLDGSFGKAYRDCSLGKHLSSKGGDQKDIYFCRSNLVYYANRCVTDMKTVSMVAVPLKCGMDVIPVSYKNLSVYDGMDELMTGRKVIKAGIGSGLTDGVVIDANVSFKDDQGCFYHGAFVVNSEDKDCQFAIAGDNGSAVIDSESGLVLGLVLATQEQYTAGNVSYDHVTLCLRLNHAVRFIYDRLHINLAKFRMF